MKPGPISDLRLFLLLWLTGMAGVVAVTVQVLPQMLAKAPELPIPLWAVYVLSTVQSGVLLGALVWAGLKLGPACGLGAPLLREPAALSSKATALSLIPALGFGLLGGVALAVLPAFAPAEIAAVNNSMSLPLLSRVLYGGITEELLLRWGIMTLFCWLLLRLARWIPLSRGLAVGLAILGSALLFGLGHLPATKQFVGFLNRDIVVYIITGNTLFGCLFGWLYYRRGLEHAIIAHAVTHVVAVGIVALRA